MSHLYAITDSDGDISSLTRCAEYMGRQRSKPDMWVVIRQPGSAGVVHVLQGSGVPYTVVESAAATPAGRLSDAVAGLPSDADVCVFAQEAWYSPTYVQWAVEQLVAGHSVFTSAELMEYAIADRAYSKVTNLKELRRDLVCLGFSADARKDVLRILGSGTSTPLRSVARGLSCHRAKTSGVNAVAVYDKFPGRLRTVSDSDDTGWHADADCVRFAEVVGSDVHSYFGTDGKVYIFSNVEYPESSKPLVAAEDVLVFLNRAESLEYYKDHPIKLVYRRMPKENYGIERLGVRNRYMYGAGDLSIPSRFMRTLEAAYDWCYPVEDEGAKSMTTGYAVAKYMRHEYPLRTVVLVNFGYSVQESTYRCPWHNWAFERYDLADFEHIFTSPEVDDSPELLKLQRAKTASSMERHITDVFTVLGCDQVIRHDYAEVYARIVSLVSGMSGGVAVIARNKPALASAIAAVLPGRAVYGICPGSDPEYDITVKTIDGSGYSPGDWEGIPRDLSLIVDDGSHDVDDLLRAMPLFLEHLAPDGFLLIEDVPSEEAVDTLLGALPGAVCHRTTPVSPYRDDRIVVYSPQGVSMDLVPVTTPVSEFDGVVASVFSEEGSDRVTRHAYASVFSKYLEPLVGGSPRILEVGRDDGSGLRSMRRLLPGAEVYGIFTSKVVYTGGATVVVGDGYAGEAWDGLPTDFDLVIDDGSHDLSDILRGIPVFLRHLKPGGHILIEDIASEKDVQAILRELPGAVCYRTPSMSEYGDDRIIVYTTPSRV